MQHISTSSATVFLQNKASCRRHLHTESFTTCHAALIHRGWTSSSSVTIRSRSVSVKAVGMEEPPRNGASSGGSGGSGSFDEVEAVTKKYGLEAGLWKVFTSKDEGSKDDGSEGGDQKSMSKGSQAGELLKRYGSAYLITSITLAVISFAICYSLVDAGVDVSALLHKVGIDVNSSNKNIGTAAIAYAAHKAASPIRFPPTVALTPIVAKFLGKETEEDEN